MGTYILRRLLLMVPTLFGIMTINFLIIQAAPGGPVERTIAVIQGFGTDATERVSGSGMGETLDTDATPGGEISSKYRGAQGLDPELIAELERMYGFDKPVHERFLQMIGQYVRFDFGESFYRDQRVVDLVKEKMPVSISRGAVDHAAGLFYLHSPWDRQGRARWLAVRCLDLGAGHRRLRHSQLPLCHPADRGFCRWALPRLVPAARPDLV